MVSAIKEISVMGDRINVPSSITDRANNLFKRVKDGNNLKGEFRKNLLSDKKYILNRNFHTIS